MEKQAVEGKFDPNAGLAISGIDGTGSDKEEDEKPPVVDEEMKDVSRKEGGMYFCCFLSFILVSFTIKI